jgi:hypothetical protein
MLELDGHLGSIGLGVGLLYEAELKALIGGWQPGSVRKSLERASPPSPVRPGRARSARARATPALWAAESAERHK